MSAATATLSTVCSRGRKRRSRTRGQQRQKRLAHVRNLRVRRSPEELRQLAADIAEGRVFTSNHLRDLRDVRHVFMVLALMDGRSLTAVQQRLGKHGFIYEEIGKAGPWSMNGYPGFMSMKLVSSAEATVVADLLQRRAQALREAALA